MRDKNAAPLQRVQIIKGWVENTTGRPFEEVIDVACSDGLTPDPVTNRCPDNDALVDVSIVQLAQIEELMKLKQFGLMILLTHQLSLSIM